MTRLEALNETLISTKEFRHVLPVGHNLIPRPVPRWGKSSQRPQEKTGGPAQKSTLTKSLLCVKIYHKMDYQLLGNHPAIQKIRELIKLVSDTAFNVLLLGETGTGKEVVARLLHASSPRRNKRFVKVSCAALPLNLLESELLGYEKGAFTGADKFKPGKFELASEGVIFLDEIGEMPLLLQAKLLEVLQSGEFARLGGTDVVKVNTWVIASTNRDLEHDIKDGRFREDLFYRLNIIKIEIPSLRERKEDLPILSEHFVKKHRQELGIEQNFRIGDEMHEIFNFYHWPGNVRELSNTIIRMMIEDDPANVKSELLSNMAVDGISIPEEMISLSEEAEAGDGDEKSVISLKTVKAKAAKDIERKVILNALDAAHGNKKVVAEMLKISYKSLFNKMNGLSIATRRRF
jgi:two-component system response regulator AtoC